MAPKDMKASKRGSLSDNLRNDVIRFIKSLLITKVYSRGDRITASLKNKKKHNFLLILSTSNLILPSYQVRATSSRGGLGGKRMTMFTQVVTYMNLRWIKSRLGHKCHQFLQYFVNNRNKGHPMPLP